MAGKASNVIAIVVTLGAAMVARKAVQATWKLGAGKQAPTNVDDPEVEMREALLFAVLTGAAVGVARMLASRRLAAMRRRSQRAVAA
jgi:hypothetical protein